MDEKEKRNQVTVAVAAMFEIYREKPSEMVLKMYVSLLMGYELEDIKKAISKVVKNVEFKPLPAHIIKYLEPDPEEQKQELRSRAENEAARVVSSIERGNRKCMEGDRITCYLLTGRWTLERLEDYRPQDIKFFMKEFVDRYILFAENPKMLDDKVSPYGLPEGERKSLVDNLTKRLNGG